MSDKEVYFYKIKAERWKDGEWWDQTLEIIVDEKGQVIEVKEVED